MYRKDTLANGIRVVSETLPKTRSLSIGVWVKVGSRHEPREVGGVSHFIEHIPGWGVRHELPLHPRI